MNAIAFASLWGIQSPLTKKQQLIERGNNMKEFYIVVNSDGQCFGVRAENPKQAFKEIEPITKADMTWIRKFSDILDRNPPSACNYIDFMSLGDCVRYGVEFR